MSDKTLRNPKWTESELILALDLYMNIPRSQISAKHPRVIELSEILNKLQAVEQINGETYRNANGAALKLLNFARFDPSGQYRGMSNGGKLEKVIWERYAGHQSELSNDAIAIRQSLIN